MQPFLLVLPTFLSSLVVGLLNLIIIYLVSKRTLREIKKCEIGNYVILVTSILMLHPYSDTNVLLLKEAMSHLQLPYGINLMKEQM